MRLEFPISISYETIYALNWWLSFSCLKPHTTSIRVVLQDEIHDPVQVDIEGRPRTPKCQTELLNVRLSDRNFHCRSCINDKCQAQSKCDAEFVSVERGSFVSNISLFFKHIRCLFQNYRNSYVWVGKGSFVSNILLFFNSIFVVYFKTRASCAEYYEGGLLQILFLSACCRFSFFQRVALQFGNN